MAELKAIRERVNGDAVAPTLLIEYLRKDCSGIVADYLRPARLPYLDELIEKTQLIAYFFNQDDEIITWSSTKGFRISRHCPTVLFDYWTLCDHPTVRKRGKKDE